MMNAPSLASIRQEPGNFRGVISVLHCYRYVPDATPPQLSRASYLYSMMLSQLSAIVPQRVLGGGHGEKSEESKEGKKGIQKTPAPGSETQQGKELDNLVHMLGGPASTDGSSVSR